MDGKTVTEPDWMAELPETITLSAADWEALLDAMSNPPEPGESLRDAVRWFRAPGSG